MGGRDPLHLLMKDWVCPWVILKVVLKASMSSQESNHGYYNSKVQKLEDNYCTTCRTSHFSLLFRFFVKTQNFWVFRYRLPPYSLIPWEFCHGVAVAQVSIVTRLRAQQLCTDRLWRPLSLLSNGNWSSFSGCKVAGTWSWPRNFF